MNTGETAFQSLCSQWLEQVRCRVAASTYMEYHRVTDVYITPALGRICLSEINSELLQQYIKDSLEKPSYSGRPLSSSSIKHILAVLKQILKFGMDRQELPPITLNGKIPETESRGGRCFRAADISRVENYAEKADIRAYSMLLCLYLGLRIGELCALRWEDIDLEQGILHVRRTVKRIENTDRSSRNRCRMVVGPPKSHTSFRDLPLPDSIWRDLIRYHAGVADDSCYLLNGRCDRFVLPRSYERSFSAWMKKCGIPEINVHSMRHSFATRCLQSGCGIKTVSEMLGHSSTAITMNLYIHTTMEEKREAVNHLYGIANTRNASAKEKMIQNTCRKKGKSGIGICLESTEKGDY